MSLSKGYTPISGITISVLLVFVQAGGCVPLYVHDDGSLNDWFSSDWPKFRHDLANTGSTDSPVPLYPYLLWKKDLGGGLTSSPSVVNNIVYIGSWETSGVPGKLHALDLNTGAPVWTYIAGPLGIPSSPAVYGGLVFFGTRNNNIVALDAATGAVRWNITTGGAVYASPSVSDGIVVVPCLDGKVYARNQTTGAKVWESMLFASSESSPAIADGKVYLGDENGFVYALYLSNGSVAWQFDTRGGFIPTSPAYSDNVVYISNSKQMKVYALDAKTGTKLWERNVSSSSSSPGIKSSPAVHNGIIFVGTRDGHIWALNATSGSVVWDKPGFGVIKSSPAVSDGKVIFGSEDGFLYVINESDGEIVWKYNTSAVMESSPTVVDGKILIGGNDHILYVFGVDTAPPAVVATNPPDGAKNVPVTEEVWIKFGEEMKTDSVSGAITVNPSFSFNLTWNPENTTVTLKRNTTLTPNTNYTVTVLGNVTDLQGNKMGSPFTFTFSTKDAIPPSVVSTRPSDKEENVSFDTTIRIQFSKQMHYNATESAFSILPGVAGSFTWDMSGRNMTFTPSKPLEGDTWYLVTISENAQDIAGNRMGRSYQFSFHTIDNVGPRVVSTDPKNGETGVKPDASIQIRFNEPPEERSAKSGVKITPDITISSITLNGTTLLIKPSALLGDTRYTVTISNVRDMKGNPGESYTFWFKTVDTTLPYVKSSDPPSGAKGVRVGTTITIVFSEEMDHPSVENSITFSPAVTFMTRWDNTTPAITITPGSILSECKKYYVNISTGAKDISGNNLAQEFSLSFTTEGDCKAPPPPPQENPYIEFILKNWIWFLLIFIIILVIAIAIPGRRTLAMYYGLDEEDEKK